MVCRIIEFILQGDSYGHFFSYEIDNAINMMELLNVTQILATSSDKTDITMQIHDINTGFNPICGFSIKSELHLLNNTK